MACPLSPAKNVTQNHYIILIRTFTWGGKHWVLLNASYLNIFIRQPKEISMRCKNYQTWSSEPDKLLRWLRFLSRENPRCSALFRVAQLNCVALQLLKQLCLFCSIFASHILFFLPKHFITLRHFYINNLLSHNLCLGLSYSAFFVFPLEKSSPFLPCNYD